MPKSPDDHHQGLVLLEIAKESIAHEVLGTPETDHPEPWLHDLGATFVTLRIADALRGCLGSLQAHRPLLVDLRENARAAASRDPRFAPLTPAEWPNTVVEVSLLSPLAEVPCHSENDAIRHLSQGRDGWYLTLGQRSGTFLPQVWDSLPEPANFLHHLKEKAGLATASWDPSIRLWRYTVRKWTTKSDPKA